MLWLLPPGMPSARKAESAPSRAIGPGTSRDCDDVSIFTVHARPLTMEDDGLSAALLAAWDDEPEAEEVAPTLVALPEALCLNVLKRLSAVDLVALSSTCRAMRSAAAEPSHWRRLCASRWPQDDAGRGQLSWRRLYFDKDAAECATASGDTQPDDLLRTIFLQHVFARRTQPPTWTSFHADADVNTVLDVPGGAGAAEAVASFRRVHGLGAGRGHEACGVAHGCVFAFMTGSRGAVVAVCTCSGKVHVCDAESTCSVEHTSADVREATVLCSVTGHIRSHAFLTAPDEDDAHDEDGAPGPAGGDFMPGVWGRCVPLLDWMGTCQPHQCTTHSPGIASLLPPQRLLRRLRSRQRGGAACDAVGRHRCSGLRQAQAGGGGGGRRRRRRRQEATEQRGRRAEAPEAGAAAEQALRSGAVCQRVILGPQAATCWSAPPPAARGAGSGRTSRCGPSGSQ